MTHTQSAEPTITAEHVKQTAPIRFTPQAERIAAYANHRAAGLRPADARREVGVNEATGGRYERWTQAVRAALGLPALPGPTSFRLLPDFDQRGESGRHSRWHVGRGISDPGCELCVGEVPDA